MSILTRHQLELVRDLVYDINGVVLRLDRAYVLEANLAKVAAGQGFVDVHQLIRALADKLIPDRLAYLVAEQLTNSETSFFRDQYPFSALEGTIIPSVVKRRRSEGRLSVWSAACSSGQEIYSVAMILNERFAEVGTWDVDLCGSDFSTTMVERAKRGRYSQLEVNRGLPASYLVKYFERDGLDWVLSEPIRQRVAFEVANLTRDGLPRKAVDIVLLRNVLIYFDGPTRERVVSRAASCLRPGGYLILGNGEIIPKNVQGLVPTQVDKLACYQAAVP